MTIGTEPFNPSECFANSLQILAEAKLEAEQGRTLREFSRYENERGNAEKAEAMKR